jgi:hypothetical protein
MPYTPAVHAPADRIQPPFEALEGFVQAASRGVYNVREAPYNAVGNGVADDTAAIAAAIDAAGATGTVYFPPGVYVSGAIARSVAPHIQATPGTVTIVTSLNAGILWRFFGSVGSQVNLGANAARNTRTLTLTSTATLAAGDLLLVGDDTAPYATEATRTRGQLVLVQSIDSGTVLSTVEALYSDFLAASNAGVQKVTPVRGVMIQGLTFDFTDSTNTAQCISVEYGRDVDIRDVTVRHNGAAAVGLKNVHQFTAELRVEDAYDNAVTGLQQFGYGVACARATTHGLVEVQARRARHAFVALGDDGARGEPHDINVYGAAYGCTSAAWDIHAQGNGITLHDVQALDCLGFGVQIRSKECHVKGAAVSNCAGGVWLFDNPGLNDINDLTVKGVRSVDGTNNQGHGVLVGVATTGLRIKGGTFEDVGRNGIVFNAAPVEVDIGGVSFRNVGVENVAGSKNCVVAVAGGTRMTIHDNAWQETGNGLNFLSLSGTFTDCRDYNNSVPNGKTVLAGGATMRSGPSMRGQGAWADRNNAITFAATLTIDASLARKQTLTLTGNVTSLTIANPTTDQELVLVLIQDATGGRTVAWPATVKFAGGVAPTLSAANKRDILAFFYDGTNWFELSRTLNMG